MNMNIVFIINNNILYIENNIFWICVRSTRKQRNKFPFAKYPRELYSFCIHLFFIGIYLIITYTEEFYIFGIE